MNRRRRRASLASKQVQLIPTFIPIDVHVPSSTHPPHPGGVTCVKVSHARCGMELYSCGKDHTIKLWRVESETVHRDSSPSPPATNSRLVHFHTIDATMHGMYNLRCLEVSQTPDVGAAWYAASHGHHATPSTTKKLSSKTSNDQAKLMAKKEKRTRGSRYTLPPKLFVAGEFMLNTKTSSPPATPSHSSASSPVNSNSDFTVIVGDNDSPPNTIDQIEKKRLAELLVTSGFDRYYGVHTYAINEVRASPNKEYVSSPEVQLEGHDSPITSLSYGPYNNGPLTSMCEGGVINVWGGNDARSSPNYEMDGSDHVSGGMSFACVGTNRSSSSASNTFSRPNSRASNTSQQSGMLVDDQPTNVLRYGTMDRPISIYASAVQPNDHLWTAGQGHLKAWPLA